MLVKNVRKMTVLPNQRIHASSRNRMKKLIRNSSMLAQTQSGRGVQSFEYQDLQDPMRPSRSLRMIHRVNKRASSP